MFESSKQEVQPLPSLCKEGQARLDREDSGGGGGGMPRGGFAKMLSQAISFIIMNTLKGSEGYIF